MPRHNVTLVVVCGALAAGAGCVRLPFVVESADLTIIATDADTDSLLNDLFLLETLLKTDWWYFGLTGVGSRSAPHPVSATVRKLDSHQIVQQAGVQDTAIRLNPLPLYGSDRSWAVSHLILKEGYVAGGAWHWFRSNDRWEVRTLEVTLRSEQPGTSQSDSRVCSDAEYVLRALPFLDSSSPEVRELCTLVHGQLTRIVRALEERPEDELSGIEGILLREARELLATYESILSAPDR